LGVAGRVLGQVLHGWFEGICPLSGGCLPGRRRPGHLAAMLVAFGLVAYILVISSIALSALLLPITLLRYIFA
jgi:hypothetical protein